MEFVQIFQVEVVVVLLCDWIMDLMLEFGSWIDEWLLIDRFNFGCIFVCEVMNWLLVEGFVELCLNCEGVFVVLLGFGDFVQLIEVYQFCEVMLGYCFVLDYFGLLDDLYVIQDSYVEVVMVCDFLCIIYINIVFYMWFYVMLDNVFIEIFVLKIYCYVVCVLNYIYQNELFEFVYQDEQFCLNLGQYVDILIIVVDKDWVWLFMLLLEYVCYVQIWFMYLLQWCGLLFGIWFDFGSGGQKWVGDVGVDVLFLVLEQCVIFVSWSWVKLVIREFFFMRC